MSNIPQAREELEELAASLNGSEWQLSAIADEILRIVETHLHRQKPSRRAPPNGKRLTLQEKEDACRLMNETYLTQPEIAARFGVNPGRISEAWAERKTK